MINFTRCHPIELDDLLRVGSAKDGGYVISKRQIENTKILLSFGINRDWTFEYDFNERKNVRVYAYDYSIKKFPFVNKKFAKEYMRMDKTLDFLRRSKVKKFKNELCLSKKFDQFFNNKAGRYFIPKFIGQYDDDKNICFESIFKELGTVEDNSVFLKMDIESAEYLCLPQLLPFIRKINGIVVEFHQLDIAEKKFDEIMEMLSEYFYVAHVHGNNCAKLIYKTNIPKVLEMTFICKSLVPGKINLSGKKYPINGLDAPCNLLAEDYQFFFTN